MAALVGLFVIGGIIAVFGGVIWLIVHLNRKRQIAWTTAAQQLGLQGNGRSIHGMLHGVAVRANTVTRGSGDNRSTYTVVSARLPMALDLGLSLRRHGLLNNMFHGSVDHIVGDQRFDSTFIVSADEAHRVRSLFGPKLRHLLLTQLNASTDFSLTDHGATIECSGASSSVPWLTWALQTVARITSGMEKARASVPVASALAHHREAWRQFADANRMQGNDTPLCMWGQLDGANVQAYAVRTGRGVYEMEVALAHPHALGLGLEVQPFGLMDKVATFFGLQDHKLGDPLFDQTFRVKVAHAEAADRLLDEPVRKELLLLQRELGPVSLDDRQLKVRLKQVPHQPALVPRTVHRMLGVADQLGSRAGALQVGPYR